MRGGDEENDKVNRSSRLQSVSSYRSVGTEHGHQIKTVLNDFKGFI